MKLVIQELLAGDGLDTVVTADKNTIIAYIRPHIYRHNFPTGDLKLQILDDGDVVIAESEVIDIVDIGSDAFFHGYVRFGINAYVTEGETYTVRLVGGSGYAFNESAYIGWANGYDLAKYPVESTPDNSLLYPLDLEIWERKVK